jgi:hypothetical protein
MNKKPKALKSKSKEEKAASAVGFVCLAPHFFLLVWVSFARSRSSPPREVNVIYSSLFL